jgi:hypothetical protein
MGWKDLAKVGKDWAEAKKDELLSSDDDVKAEARARADAARDQVQGEIGTSFLESVLPPDLAKHVTAARPENVAAREAERAVQEEAQRRADLASRATGLLQLTVTGDEQGSVAVSLPMQRSEDDPDPAPDPDHPDDPPPVPWLTVVLEAADPVPVGSTTLFALSLAVPGYRGVPGRYDIHDLYERGQRGETESWDAFDLYLAPHAEAGDTQWWWDGTGPAHIDVQPGFIAFDLPMQSAVSAIRITGTISWGE